jgi:hypothetical protein
MGIEFEKVGSGVGDDVVTTGITGMDTAQGSIFAVIELTFLDHPNWGTIYCSSDEASDVKFLRFMMTDTNKIAVHARNDGNNDIVNGDTIFTTNTKYHICLTSSGTTYKLYVNGEEEGLTVAAGSNSGNWFSDIPDRDNSTLGRTVRLNPISTFWGIISELVIWDVELTLAQVKQLYNSRLKGMGDQISPDDRVLDLRMDDGLDGTSADGDTVRDYSGNSNDGTGDDGADNTGLTWKAEDYLSYPNDVILTTLSEAVVIPYEILLSKLKPGIRIGQQLGIR